MKEWILALAAGGLLTVGIVRYVSWWRGVGELGQQMALKDPERFAFTARLGYAFLPFIVGGTLLTAGMLLINLGEAVESRMLEAGGVVLGVFTFPVWVWALKEYVRPSAWMPSPEWLREFEQANGRWSGGGIPWRKW